MASDNIINTKFTVDPTDFNDNVKSMFSVLQRSSDSAITGLVKGTETWQNALFNVLASVEAKFIQTFANVALYNVQMLFTGLHAQQQTDAEAVASNNVKNASISANNEAADQKNSTAHIAQVIKQIQSDAAATYAGVFAYLSPVLGPAAAVPAGASAAAVAAMEGLVSLDVGAWSIPQDMPAYLHAGEMVVPQNFAQGMRDGSGLGGSGGDNYTININAVDTQTGAQFLKNNASTIANLISSQVRNFNKSMPAWKS